VCLRWSNARDPDWFAVGGALHAVAPSPALFAVWNQFSQLCPARKRDVFKSHIQGSSRHALHQRGDNHADRGLAEAGASTSQ
jgi:hypothetical protein